MNINQHNYEAFFLDYVEGNLSAEVVAELILFLEENPTLKEELEGFDLLKLNDVEDVSFNKESLKFNINKNNIEEFIIGSIEGVNSDDDEIELNEFIKNDDESQTLLSRYKKTILITPEVVFPNKYSLKKRSRVVVLYPLLGVAASLLIFFILSNGNKQEYSPQELIANSHIVFEKEESNDFIASQVLITPENIEEEEEVKKDTSFQYEPIPEEYVSPRNENELIASVVDSSELNPKKRELSPTPEDLIVAIDSANTPKTDSIISFDEPSNNDLTFNEWTNNQIRNKVLNQDSEDVSKIKHDEVFEAIAGGLNKISKQDVAYNSYASNSTTTKGFRIGNFEFSRTKRKKF